MKNTKRPLTVQVDLQKSTEHPHVESTQHPHVKGSSEPIEHPDVEGSSKLIQHAYVKASDKSTQHPHVKANGFTYPMEEIDIGPDLATEWLEINHCRRRQSMRTILGLLKAVEAGDFPFTGEAIRLSPPDPISGKRALLDGQHRLEAIRRSGKTVKCLVIKDFPEALFDYIDQGRPRNVRDLLKGLDFPTAAALSSAARCIWLFERQALGMRQADVAPTNSELFRTIERHPELLSWVKECRKNRGMSLSAIAACCYWITKTGDLRAEEFINSLLDATGLSIVDTIYQIRERILLDRRIFSYGAGGRMRLCWVIFRGWELYVNNQRRQMLKIPLKTMRTIPWPGGAPYITSAPAVYSAMLDQI